MSVPPDPGPLPVLDRGDVESALVTVFAVQDPARRSVLARAVVDFWRTVEWPDGLFSVNCYTSTDGRSVLTYVQWVSDQALRNWLGTRAGGDRSGPVAGLTDVEITGPTQYRLRQVVRGSAVTDPEARPACFPVAFFDMANEAEAAKWIDELLKAEETTGGQARSYPGGIGANIHVSADGTSVMIFSEWMSEKHFADHLNEVIEPVLDEVGDNGAGASPTYRHYRSLSPSHG